MKRFAIAALACLAAAPLAAESVDSSTAAAAESTGAVQASSSPAKSDFKIPSKVPPSMRRKSTKERIKQPVEELKKAAQPVEEAVTKTAQTAAKEVTEAAKGAHSLGGKVLQGIINVMVAASPGKTRVYLPAPSSDPNSGITVGVLPVFMFVDDKEEIRHILAPSLTWNRIFKLNSTFRYYWYPRPGAQLFVLGAYAMETNRRATVRYEDPSFFADWFYFKFDATANHDGSFRFFGVGPDTREEAQTNYTLLDYYINTHTGVNFLERMRATLTHRFRRGDTTAGPIDSLPQITQFAPRPPGVEDPRLTMAQRLTLSYDSRDLVMAPIRGHVLSAFVEKAGHLGGSVDYTRVGGEARGFYPLRGARFVTGWRFLLEGEDGTNTPFYEQSLLGGKDSLRGFGDARFVDRKRTTFALEERIRLYTLKAFNVNIDFEVTPYYEAGTVFHNFDKFQPSMLHHVGGVGFRSVVRPNVVGVIDLGFGEEGTALFVGIDYPF